MNVLPREGLSSVLVLEPRVFGDDRGYFMETFSTRTFPELTPPVQFVQDNVSYSKRGILRGLHLQHPNDQGKLVMVVTGSILDVAVDVRVGSPTFGLWTSAELSEQNHRQMYIPPGFAHGFCVTSPTAHVHYKCTALYDPKSELSLRYDDPDIGIDWPVESPTVSEKDGQAPLLRDVPRDRLPRYEG